MSIGCPSSTIPSSSYLLHRSSLRIISSDKGASGSNRETGAAKAQAAALGSHIDAPVVRDRTPPSATTEGARIQ
ncbi:unnamed protein product, partial [Ectocarpus sp. 12 AP-2014]